MNIVVTVNLAGRAWQLEEAAYEALQQYLDDASRRLEGNPDRDEILADFESAIADMCSERLGLHKDVVELAEMKSILDHLGVVEEADADDQQTVELPQAEPASKRFYRIEEGKIVGGVSTGLAAYFNVDVTVIRLIWVLATLISGGAVILLYIALMIFISKAETSEQRAEASGERSDARGLLHKARSTAAPVGSGVGEIIRVIGKFTMSLLAITAALLAISVVAVWVAALWSSIADGYLFGWGFDVGTDTWLLRAWVTAVAWVLIVPLAAIAVGAKRTFSDRTHHTNPVWWFAGLMTWVAALVSAFMIAWTSTPDARRALETDSDSGIVRFGNFTFCVKNNTAWHPNSTPEYCMDRNRLNHYELVEPAEPAEPADPAEPAEPAEPVEIDE